MEKSYTPEDVAEKIGLKKTTIWKYIRNGKIIANKFGTHYRITQEQLDVFLAASSTVQQIAGTQLNERSEIQ